MKPSIGRIVHWTTQKTSYNETNDRNDPVDGEFLTFPAIIVSINEAKLYAAPDQEPKTEPSANVDLQVFGYSSGSGKPWFKAVPFSPTPKVGHWSWPPKV